LTKWLRGPDETALRAAVWRRLMYADRKLRIKLTWFKGMFMKTPIGAYVFEVGVSMAASMAAVRVVDI